jgi:hypothetical protein
MGQRRPVHPDVHQLRGEPVSLVAFVSLLGHQPGSAVPQGTPHSRLIGKPLLLRPSDRVGQTGWHFAVGLVDDPGAAVDIEPANTLLLRGSASTLGKWGKSILATPGGVGVWPDPLN